jgi:hypothetical protein
MFASGGGITAQVKDNYLAMPVLREKLWLQGGRRE